MAKKDKKPSKKTLNFQKEYQLIMFLATLGLAALALVLQTESPVVWAFLGVSIGHLFGKNAI